MRRLICAVSYVSKGENEVKVIRGDIHKETHTHAQLEKKKNHV